MSLTTCNYIYYSYHFQPDIALSYLPCGWKYASTMITANILAIGVLVVSVTLVVISFLRSAFAEGLRDLPGPLGARFLGIQRVRMTRSGDAPKHHRALHEKYGSVVRIAPGHVSISDPAMVPIIYGINSKFTKVCYCMMDMKTSTCP